MADRFGAMSNLLDAPGDSGGPVRRQVPQVTEHRTALWRDRRVYSVEKDDPQPHVDLAFGLLMVNPPPVMVSTKSTSAFFKILDADRVDEQLDTVRLEDLFPAPCPFSSISRPY